MVYGPVWKVFLLAVRSPKRRRLRNPWRFIVRLRLRLQNRGRLLLSQSQLHCHFLHPFLFLHLFPSRRYLRSVVRRLFRYRPSPVRRVTCTSTRLRVCPLGWLVRRWSSSSGIVSSSLHLSGLLLRDCHLPLTPLRRLRRSRWVYRRTLMAEHGLAPRLESPLEPEQRINDLSRTIISQPIRDDYARHDCHRPKKKHSSFLLHHIDL